MVVHVNSKDFHECETCAKEEHCTRLIRNLFGGCTTDYEERRPESIVSIESRESRNHKRT